MNSKKILHGLIVFFFFVLSSSAYSATDFNLAANYKTMRNIPLRAHRLLIPSMVPVQVSVANVNWIETIYICNTSGSPIPLKTLEFRFNYGVPMPTNIWGKPWAGWKVVSQTNSAVVLSGGTPVPLDLPSDPNCMQPLTISFNAPPTAPEPTGPFELTVDSGPVGETTGAVNVTIGAAPAADLPVPIVAINGQVANQQRQVDWGSAWKLSHLEPGDYLITGVPVSANGKSYQVNPVTVSVVADNTVQVSLNYQLSLNVGKVSIDLINSPAKSVPVEFKGTKQTFRLNVSKNTALSLPSDSYTISSDLANYTIQATPNPLIVPNQKGLTLVAKPAKQGTLERTIHVVNKCPFPVWFGLISGATPSRTGDVCHTDSDCHPGSTCVKRSGGMNQCFWKNPKPANNNYQLAANGGTNSVKIPIYNGGLSSIWNGAVAGRTNCTGAGCETADCGGGTGACHVGRGFIQPATQAEFSFGKTSADFYDVETINGLNIPLSLQPVNAPKSTNPFKCGGAGVTRVQNGMGGCSWDLTPPSNDFVWVRAGGKACVADNACPAAEKCGLSYQPGKSPVLQKTCGKQIGYWSANQICTLQPDFGAPFNCKTRLSSPHQDLTFSNLYTCSKLISCDARGPSSRCCGCADWPQLGVEVPTSPSMKYCSSTNLSWVDHALPTLLWVKKACPSIYTYAYDDQSSTYTCQVMNDNNGTQVNSTNYTVTFCPDGKTGGLLG